MPITTKSAVIPLSGPAMAGTNTGEPRTRSVMPVSAKTTTARRAARLGPLLAKPLRTSLPTSTVVFPTLTFASDHPREAGKAPLLPSGGQPAFSAPNIGQGGPPCRTSSASTHDPDSSVPSPVEAASLAAPQESNLALLLVPRCHAPSKRTAHLDGTTNNQATWLEARTRALPPRTTKPPLSGPGHRPCRSKPMTSTLPSCRS